MSTDLAIFSPWISFLLHIVLFFSLVALFLAVKGYSPLSSYLTVPLFSELVSGDQQELHKESEFDPEN